MQEFIGVSYIDWEILQPFLGGGTEKFTIGSFILAPSIMDDLL